MENSWLVIDNEVDAVNGFWKYVYSIYVFNNRGIYQATRIDSSIARLKYSLHYNPIHNKFRLVDIGTDNSITYLDQFWRRYENIKTISIGLHLVPGGIELDNIDTISLLGKNKKILVFDRNKIKTV